MPKASHLFVVVLLICSFSIVSNAQGAVSYKFLEVVDYADKPVADATVNIRASCNGGDVKTNEQGRLAKGFPIGGGDCRTHGFSISKDDYYPFTDYFGVIESIEDSSPDAPTKVELLKIPRNKAERKALGNEQLKREFFVAARADDILAVRKFLKLGFSPNLTTSDLRGFPGKKDVPIILFAIASRNFAMTNEFLSAGVDVRKIPDILVSYLAENPYQGNYGDSEEITKGKKIYEDGLETLVEKGADVNAKGAGGIMVVGNELTTLMIAAHQGLPRTVKLLIDKGVPVNVKDEFSRTALIHAVMSPHQKSKFSIIKLLLEAGADPNVIAIDNDSDYRAHCQLPLIHAVLSDDPAIVRLLIEHKANVKLSCKNGRNALGTALERKKYDYTKNADEIIRILEEAGAR